MKHPDDRILEPHAPFRVPSICSEYLGKKNFDVLHACANVLSLIRSSGNKIRAVRKALRERGGDVTEIERSCTKVLRALDVNQNDIRGAMNASMGLIGKVEKWWEKVNILRLRIRLDLTAKLFEQNSPQDLDYAEYVRKSMYILHRCRLTPQGLRMFFRKLVDEINRVRRMPMIGSHKAALDLFLEVKFHLLREQDASWFGDDYFVQYHDNIDHWLSIMLQVGRRTSYPFRERNYVDAAKACREIRQRMHSKPCSAWNHGCVFNTLIPTLHTLQHQAYEEIRYTVYAAVGTRLPLELAHMVFERAMLAEEVPLDPRIFVNAQHDSYGIRARKSRIVCPHVKRNSPKLQAFRLDRGRPMLAIGPEWIELGPKYPHHDFQARQREDRKCLWFAYGYWEFL